MATKQIRPIRVEGNIAYVPLTRGYEAIIDAADVSLVDGYNWSANLRFFRGGSIRTVYAYRQQRLGGRKIMILLHRHLLGAPSGILVDHKDGCGLNNRRRNLRQANGSQNAQNSQTPVTNTSGARGATWLPKTRKWQVQIKANGRCYHIGSFTDRGEAARAYEAASARLHGEFAFALADTPDETVLRTGDLMIRQRDAACE